MQSNYITILMFILQYEVLSTASVNNIQSYCKIYIHLIKTNVHLLYFHQLHIQSHHQRSL